MKMQLYLETVLATESHMPETSSAETEGSDRKWCTQFTGWEAVQMSLGFQKKILLLPKKLEASIGNHVLFLSYCCGKKRKRGVTRGTQKNLKF